MRIIINFCFITSILKKYKIFKKVFIVSNTTLLFEKMDTQAFQINIDKPLQYHIKDFLQKVIGFLKSHILYIHMQKDQLLSEV